MVSSASNFMRFVLTKKSVLVLRTGEASRKKKENMKILKISCLVFYFLLVFVYICISACFLFFVDVFLLLFSFFVRLAKKMVGRLQ